MSYDVTSQISSFVMNYCFLSLLILDNLQYFMLSLISLFIYTYQTVKAVFIFYYYTIHI